jgi:hypothetical protein
LGDQVSFRLGLFGHTGLVEGIDPHNKKAVMICSPAFMGSNISILSNSITKIDKEQAKEIIKETLPEKADIHWSINCLATEIATLRARKKEWTREDYLSLLLYEQQLDRLERRLKTNAIMTSIT